MRSTSLALTILALAVVATGCDKSGIHPLGEKRDVISSANTPTSTWMRTWTEPLSGGGTAPATDVLLIGSTTPTTATSSSTQIFVRATVSKDSRTLLDFGTYQLDGQGNGTFSYTAHYQFFPEPQKSLLQRTGAVRTDYTPAKTQALEIKDGGDGKTILVSFGGVQHRYTNMIDVARKLDPTTQAGAADVYRLYNLPLFTSQCRVGGFGSTAMTQYIPSPGTFQALIANSFQVWVEGYANPTAHITYDGPDVVDGGVGADTDGGVAGKFQELTGIEISGDQVTAVNISGDGPMRGVLVWSMTDPASKTVILSGTLDYSHLVVGNGVAASGYYLMNIDGHGSYQFQYTIATDEDFTDVLPVDATDSSGGF